MQLEYGNYFRKDVYYTIFASYEEIIISCLPLLMSRPAWKTQHSTVDFIIISMILRYIIFQFGGG